MGKSLPLHFTKQPQSLQYNHVSIWLVLVVLHLSSQIPILLDQVDCSFVQCCYSLRLDYFGYALFHWECRPIWCENTWNVPADLLGHPWGLPLFMVNRRIARIAETWAGPIMNTCTGAYQHGMFVRVDKTEVSLRKTKLSLLSRTFSTKYKYYQDKIIILHLRYYSLASDFAMWSKNAMILLWKCENLKAIKPGIDHTAFTSTFD